MKDLIYRQDAIDAVDVKSVNEGIVSALQSIIEELPSAEPEAKPPKWVAEDRYMKNHFKVFPHCPQCNAEVTTGQCYCMICGQHIDWSEDDG